MSYHIYTTKGIVLSERAVGEADRIYSILTRDLGKIEARAIGIRKSSSKLRGSLEPFSLSSISFVKGKEYWRATSAEFIQNISSAPPVARPLVLLEKLVQGEAPNPGLFNAVERMVQRRQPVGLTPCAYQLPDERFEIELVSQILFHLGYLKKSDLTSDKESLVKAINEGIQASHL